MAKPKITIPQTDNWDTPKTVIPTTTPIQQETPIAPKTPIAETIKIELPSLDVQVREYQALHPYPLYHLAQVTKDLNLEIKDRQSIALAWHRVFEGNYKVQIALVSE
jgi:hypothetical protein